MRVMYPGTFDPVTYGHEEIIKRAIKLFPSLLIAVADNPIKKTLFSLSDRVDMLRQVVMDMPGVEVLPFCNLTVDFAREQQIGVIVRGLRALSDFDFEFQLAGSNRMLDPDIETIFLPTSAQEACVSSSLVREIARLGGNLERFVRPCVADRVRATILGDLNKAIKR